MQENRGVFRRVVLLPSELVSRYRFMNLSKTDDNDTTQK